MLLLSKKNIYFSILFDSSLFAILYFNNEIIHAISYIYMYSGTDKEIYLGKAKPSFARLWRVKTSKKDARENICPPPRIQGGGGMIDVQQQVFPLLYQLYEIKQIIAPI